VRVTEQRPGKRFLVVKCALAAFRYLVTSLVALLLALPLMLLMVEVGAAIGTALEHARGDMPGFGDFGGSVRSQRASDAVFMEGGS
jgi:hypothetical protein